MTSIVDKFTVGSSAIVAQDCDIRGDITIGTGCILHPRCTILAMNGPIVLGENCIVEENAVILNRQSHTMMIGSNNLFEVGSRICSNSSRSYNTFEPKSRVTANISISDWTTIGAGCIVQPTPSFKTASTAVADEPSEDSTNHSTLSEASETLPSRTVVFGAESRRRIWSGESKLQAQALHAKHIDTLREMLPKYMKLKVFTSSSVSI